MPADSIATSVPQPMAMPTSAARVRAGASFTAVADHCQRVSRAFATLRPFGPCVRAGLRKDASISQLVRDRFCHGLTVAVSMATSIPIFVQLVYRAFAFGADDNCNGDRRDDFVLISNGALESAYYARGNQYARGNPYARGGTLRADESSLARRRLQRRAAHQITTVCELLLADSVKRLDVSLREREKAFPTNRGPPT